MLVMLSKGMVVVIDDVIIAPFHSHVHHNYILTVEALQDLPLQSTDGSICLYCIT